MSLIDASPPSWSTASSWRSRLLYSLCASFVVCASATSVSAQITVMGLSDVTTSPMSIPPPSVVTLDTDGDRLLDNWEVQIFQTDPLKKDTDSDGFEDRVEIQKGFNPIGKGNLVEKDKDADGLSDRLELAFESDPLNPDTDGDTFLDGKEIYQAFSPTNTSRIPLEKSLRITIATQTVTQNVMGIAIKSHIVSSGLPRTPTPLGTFKILQKHPRAWSNSAKLWMPYWMHFSGRGHGFHELPEWPGGRKEGANHLGKKASHGCVRMGVGNAKEVYEWTPVGTPVTIVAR